MQGCLTALFILNFCTACNVKCKPSLKLLCQVGNCLQAEAFLPSLLWIIPRVSCRASIIVWMLSVCWWLLSLLHFASFILVHLIDWLLYFAVKKFDDHEQINIHDMGWLSKIFKGSRHNISRGHYHGNRGQDANYNAPSTSRVFTHLI